MSSLLASKAPLNGNPMTVHTTTPSLSFSPQRGAICDPSPPQTLPGEQADGDLSLVQPAAMFGGVVNRESIPQPSSRFLAEPFHHRLAGMRVQIVQHQVNGVSLGIADGKVQQA